MQKRILITHGRRIICPCGYQDKASISAARQHNNKVHGGKYRIVLSVGETHDS